MSGPLTYLLRAPGCFTGPCESLFSVAISKALEMPIGTEIIELYLPEKIMSGFDDHIDNGMRHAGLVPTKEEKRKGDQYAALRAENAKLREALKKLLSHYGDAREALFPHKTPHDTPAMQEARAALASHGKD